MDLLSGLKLSGMEMVLDLGCGDGKISAQIAEIVPYGSVLGIDSSPEMIEYAKKTHPKKECPNLDFFCCDMRTIDYTEDFDRVFSNAAMHWVKDQGRVLRNIYQSLKPGGLMVIQMGGRGNAGDLFACITPLMETKPWIRYFQDFEFPYAFPDPDEYVTLLRKTGFTKCIVQLKGKDMVHEGLEGFSGWIRTTWMPYLDRLPSRLRSRFIIAIYREYTKLYPPDSFGNIHIAMVRLEAIAERH